MWKGNKHKIFSLQVNLWHDTTYYLTGLHHRYLNTVSWKILLQSKNQKKLDKRNLGMYLRTIQKYRIIILSLIKAMNFKLLTSVFIVTL